MAVSHDMIDGLVKASSKQADGSNLNQSDPWKIIHGGSKYDQLNEKGSFRWNWE